VAGVGAKGEYPINRPYLHHSSGTSSTVTVARALMLPEMFAAQLNER
jgi:hypothetical protein